MFFTLSNLKFQSLSAKSDQDTKRQNTGLKLEKPSNGENTFRFKRVTEVFFGGGGESSSSERPADQSLTDLSDLVNSFLESDEIEEIDTSYEAERINGSDSEIFCCNSGIKNLLRGFLENDENGDVKEKIRVEVELACGAIGDKSSSPEFKRRLMSSLRERGFDAGLCKSKWEKTRQSPPGNYEYIDVNVAGIRYIVEVFIAGEFEIARPTNRYASLIEILPPIFVGEIEELKQIVRLMCKSIKKSLKTFEMHVPPWRRYVYMQAKWFSSHKRTINEVLDNKGSDFKEELVRKRAVGFVPMKGTSSY